MCQCLSRQAATRSEKVAYRECSNNRIFGKHIDTEGSEWIATDRYGFQCTPVQQMDIFVHLMKRNNGGAVWMAVGDEYLLKISCLS